jgi:hypothetical protein
MPELALLLGHGAVGHHERDPPGRAGIAQRPGDRGSGIICRTSPPRSSASSLVALVQPEPLADDHGKPLPWFEAVPVDRHEPVRVGWICPLAWRLAGWIDCRAIVTADAVII